MKKENNRTPVKKGSFWASFKAIRFLFKKPKTIKYPFEKKEPALRYRGFHLNDWDKCTGCGNCANICQNKAITMEEIPELNVKPEEGVKNERPEIDYGRCCFCGLCVDICPAGSLRLSRDYLHIHFKTDTFSLIPKDEKSDKEHFLPAEKYSVLKASLTHRKKDYEGFSPDIKYSLFDPERVEMLQVKPEERISSFIEIVQGYSKEQALKEASRCLDCGLCTQACPANMDIPEYISAIWEDNLEESARWIYKTNPLASVCGRVCTHNCESVCALSLRGEPVAIRWLKRYALDSIPADKLKEIASENIIKKTDKRVAIIGAGPAGLSCAYYLALMGYKITIYEMMPDAGGIMRYGIPEYRLPYEALNKDIETIKSVGVEIVYNTQVGKDISLSEIKNNFDAVFSGVGLPLGRSTRTEGSDLEGVYKAIDLLSDFTLRKPVPVEGKIVIIGGGNVAMDIARTMVRLQREKFGRVDITVTSLESRDIMPADEEEIVEAEEEGVKFYPARGPEKISRTEKRLKLDTVQCTRVFDETGKFNPLFNKDNKLSFDADMVVEAIGQAPLEGWLDDKVKGKLGYQRRRIKINEYCQTSLGWLFVGGDIVRGPDVISAIDSGHKAAKGIDTLLNK